MRHISVVLLLSLFVTVLANDVPQFDNEQQQKQYYDLTRVIRCPTCQNQNVAESDAPLARQLRAQIETQIHDGRSNAEISAYLVERYGDFITYTPPFAARTWLLWLTPFAVMLLSLLWWLTRRRQNSQQRLNPEQQAELQTLIARHRKKS